MQCPTDGSTLVMTDRSGIEIDYCPQCRGVWLDRGELDKIIERAAPSVMGAARAPEPAPPGPPRYDDRYDDRARYEERPRYDDRPRYDERSSKKRKKRSFLEEIFDFD